MLMSRFNTQDNCGTHATTTLRSLSCRIYYSIGFAYVDNHMALQGRTCTLPSLLTCPSSLSSNTAAWLWHTSRGIICGWNSTTLLIPKSNHCEKPYQRFQSERVFWRYRVVKCHLPFLRFNLFHLAWWQCSMCRDTAAQMASGSLCFEMHFAWLRFGECSETPVDCNGLCAAFPSRGGVCPVTRQMENTDSPGALACYIFLLNWKVFGNSSGQIRWPPFLLTFSLSLYVT